MSSLNHIEIGKDLDSTTLSASTRFINCFSNLFSVLSSPPRLAKASWDEDDDNMMVIFREKRKVKSLPQLFYVGGSKKANLNLEQFWAQLALILSPSILSISAPFYGCLKLLKATLQKGDKSKEGSNWESNSRYLSHKKRACLNNTLARNFSCEKGNDTEMIISSSSR